MSKIKVTAFSVSLDGFGAGPDQNRENPLGKRGEELHEWVIPTKMFRKMGGKRGRNGRNQSAQAWIHRNANLVRQCRNACDLKEKQVIRLHGIKSQTASKLSCSACK